MDWRFEYVDLEKIRELMEKSDEWEESKQREFYRYLLERKDRFFKSSFGDLFLELYEQKLGVSDLEMIRQSQKSGQEAGEKGRRRRLLRALPVLLLAVAVSAGSIWSYRKLEALEARRHLETLRERVQQSEADKGMEADDVQEAARVSVSDVVQGTGVTDTDDVQGYVPSGAADGIQETKDEAVRPVLAQYQKLAVQYPELFGWLTIPESGINYPVMQPTAEKDYYLHHNYAGMSDDEGALFVDPASSGYPPDDNLVIYGHNMKNGHMFGELKNYGVESYFRSHQKLSFDSLYEAGDYEVVTVIQTHIRDEAEEGFRYYQFFNYETEEEFQECVDFIQENQIYDVENKLQYGDHLLMLSTCDYAQDNGRFVVIARKTEG